MCRFCPLVFFQYLCANYQFSRSVWLAFKMVNLQNLGRSTCECPIQVEILTKVGLPKASLNLTNNRYIILTCFFKSKPCEIHILFFPNIFVYLYIQLLMHVCQKFFICKANKKIYGQTIGQLPKSKDHANLSFKLHPYGIYIIFFRNVFGIPLYLPLLEMSARKPSTIRQLRMCMV